MLDNALENLKAQILKLKPKQQKIMEKWLGVWGAYIEKEETFDSRKLRAYNRGELIHVHLGFNVGREEGGARYAVIIENGNSKSSDIVVIVPLSTLKEGQTKESLHGSEVYLGEVISGSQKEAYAMPLHIRGVSKIRIIRPKWSNDNVYTLCPDKLTEIDDKIKALFTHTKRS